MKKIWWLIFENISRFVKYNLYLVYVSSYFHIFKTVNIWRTRQIIEKWKTPCRCIMIWCSTEIKTRQTIFHDTAPLMKQFSNERYLTLCAASLLSFWNFTILCSNSLTLIMLSLFSFSTSFLLEIFVLIAYINWELKGNGNKMTTNFFIVLYERAWKNWPFTVIHYLF